MDIMWQCAKDNSACGGHARRHRMRKYDVVVVGGSAAGVSAAITARRHNPDKTILLIRKEARAVIPCGIPYIFGTLGSAEKNLISDEILSKNGIDLLIREVTAIDRDARTITTAEKENVGYQRLVLATGSLPITPPVLGVGKEDVFAISKDASYLNQVLNVIDKASDLVIVGGGFIGCEVAEECRKRRKDLNITIVEMLRHCLQAVYDEEFCERAEEILRKEGISILANEKADAFLGDGGVERVKLTSGREIKADVVIMGIGTRANIELAEGAGLHIGPTKGIQVNRYMQTSDQNIFACGDCTEKVSFFDGKPSSLKLASISAMEARIVGANLFSTRRVNVGAIGVYSTILGNTTLAAAGLTKSEARRRGYAFAVGESESVNRHPGSMPGADHLKVTLIFERGSRVILGGQVIGATSGGELINAVSACIHQRMTADDIATFQMGTHPALTASPISYQLVNAAENAIGNMSSSQ